MGSGQSKPSQSFLYLLITDISVVWGDAASFHLWLPGEPCYDHMLDLPLDQPTLSRLHSVLFFFVWGTPQEIPPFFLQLSEFASISVSCVELLAFVTKCTWVPSLLLRIRIPG